MSAPIVIGMGGRLRAGKDAVADRLVDQHGFVKMGMSDALLEHALILDPWIPVNAGHRDCHFGLSGDFMRLSRLVETIGYVEAKKNPEVRRFLMADGTEGGRDFHSEDVWVDRMSERVWTHFKVDQPVVVTGIRFPNELKMIRGFGGYGLWVDRPVDSGASAEAIVHPSETSVDGSLFDRTIVNAGTLGDLHASVDALIKEFTS